MNDEIRKVLEQAEDERHTAYILRIDEPEFGCEGVPEQGSICDTVRLAVRGEDGKAQTRTVLVEERLVWEYKLDEGMWMDRELCRKTGVMKS